MIDKEKTKASIIALLMDNGYQANSYVVDDLYEYIQEREREAIQAFTVYLFKLGEGNKTEIAEMFIKDRFKQKEKQK